MSKHDEAQVRNVIDDWAAGLRAKTPSASRATASATWYISRSHRRWSPTRTAHSACKSGLTPGRARLGYELRDLEIVAGDDVAFSHSLNHLTGTQGGEKADVWFRSTLCFRKIDGEWKIAHEHESVPFLMDGSDKAALDLKP